MTKDAVSDLELMQYFDGELEDEERVRAVERHLDASTPHRAKLSALGVVGEAARRTSEERAASFDVAAEVMDKIAAEKIPRRAAGAAPPKTTAPANDNSRSIFALAAVAVAAAAALMIWGRGGETAPPPAQAPIANMEAPAPKTDRDVQAPAASNVEEKRADAASARPVEVAAVDFGDNTGTIMYAPAEDGATTVIWIHPSGE